MVNLFLKNVGFLLLGVHKFIGKSNDRTFWVNLTTDLFEAKISANKISLPQGQSYTEKEYYNGSKNLNLNLRERLMINLK